MFIKKRIIVILSLAYMYIPMILFYFGWTKLWIGVLCASTVLYGMIKLFKTVGDNSEHTKDLVMHIKPFVIVLIFLLMICYYCGYGRLTPQAGDWHKHNAVLYDLVNKDWPVRYFNGNESSMLTYYIAQYLMPALVGKLFHSCKVAEIAMLFWNYLGLVLIYLNLARLLNARTVGGQTLIAVCMIFFSGPLLLAHKLQELVFPEDLISVTNPHWMVSNSMNTGFMLQYSSNFTLLRWVFPQVIVTWLAVVLFVEYRKEVQNYVTLMLPTMLYATLAFIGILPIAFISAIWEVIKNSKNGNICIAVSRLFSRSNILAAIVQGTVLMAYFYGNVFGDKPDDIGLEIVTYQGADWARYLFFVGCMVGIYSLCVLKENRKNVIFMAAIFELCILPFFKMGLYNDLVMRASIPALFILFIACTSHLIRVIESGQEKCEWRTIILIVVLCIGMVYPIEELSGVIKSDNLLERDSDMEWDTLESFASRYDEKVSMDVRYNYYTYDYDKSIFYKFIARTE